MNLDRGPDYLMSHRIQLRRRLTQITVRRDLVIIWHGFPPPWLLGALAFLARPRVLITQAACVTRYSTAIRTARPLVTCCRIPLWGPSAIPELISIPRFMGPRTI